MRYSELNLFGVFISPMAAMLLAAWLLTAFIRLIANRAGLTRHIWHPALANLSVLIIVASLIIIGAGRFR